MRHRAGILGLCALITLTIGRNGWAEEASEPAGPDETLPAEVDEPEADEAEAQPIDMDTGPHMTLRCQQVECRCVEPSSPIATPPPGWRRAPTPRETDETDGEPQQQAQVAPETPEWHETPAPIGGFPLQRGRVGFQVEAGYPFLDLRFSYGALDWLELGLGYRGFYSLSNGGYGQLKFRVFQNDERTISLSLVASGGYTRTRSSYADFITELVASDGGFGEVQFHVAARRGRHMLLVDVGLRIAQIVDYECDDDDDDYYSDCDYMPLDGEGGVYVTGSAELGWAMRVMSFASIYFAAGVDLFFNNDNLPALPRGRLGLIFDF